MLRSTVVENGADIRKVLLESYTPPTDDDLHVVFTDVSMGRRTKIPILSAYAVGIVHGNHLNNVNEDVQEMKDVGRDKRTDGYTFCFEGVENITLDPGHEDFRGVELLPLAKTALMSKDGPLFRDLIRSLFGLVLRTTFFPELKDAYMTKYKPSANNGVPDHFKTDLFEGIMMITAKKRKPEAVCKVAVTDVMNEEWRYMLTQQRRKDRFSLAPYSDYEYERMQGGSVKQRRGYNQKPRERRTGTSSGRSSRPSSSPYEEEVVVRTEQEERDRRNRLARARAINEMDRAEREREEMNDDLEDIRTCDSPNEERPPSRPRLNAGLEDSSDDEEIVLDSEGSLNGDENGEEMNDFDCSENPPSPRTLSLQKNASYGFAPNEMTRDDDEETEAPELVSAAGRTTRSPQMAKKAKFDKAAELTSSLTHEQMEQLMRNWQAKQAEAREQNSPRRN